MTEHTISDSFKAHPLLGWGIVGLAVSSLFFSLGMFAWQIANDTEQVSGRVVSVATSSIEIIDGRGERTTVSIASTTEMIGRTTIVAPGQFVHIFGRQIEGGDFESESIQIVKQRKEDDIKRLPPETR
jgi:hypothetical protein